MSEEHRAPIIIRTPDDAWEVLRGVTENRFDPYSFYEVEFAGWSVELLRLSSVQSLSISIATMRSFTEYQRRINKSFKSIKYQERAPQRLSKLDSDNLELNIVVEANGSVYKADVKKALTTLVRAAADKMESKHLTLTAISVALILGVGYFGTDAFKTYLASEAASRDLATHADEIIKLSEQETARAKILGSLAAENEQARSALMQVQASYQAMLKAAATAGDAHVLGVPVPQDLARDLVANPRRSGEGTRMDGKFEVVDIERRELGAYSVILKAPADETPINAEVHAMFVPDDQIDFLLGSLKTGRQLNIMMNAWKRGDKIASAEIVRVNPE